MENRLKQLLFKKMQEEQKIITPTLLAKETGISRPTIHRWLANDVTHFPGDTIEVLCKYLKCEVGELLVMVDTTQ